MLLTRELDQGVEVLAVVGPVAEHDVAVLRQALDRAVGGCPRGVVVDLSDAGTLPPAAVDIVNWATVQATGWPRPALAVCRGGEELARLLRPEVQQHACREDAVAHVDDRPEEQVCVRATVTCGPQGPGEARTLAQECARAHGFDGADLALVITELVTNAVRHGSPPVEVEIDTCEHCVTVVVADGGRGRPERRRAGATDEGGRGLLLVDLLAGDHGVRPTGTGKAVWAELPRRREPTGGT